MGCAAVASAGAGGVGDERQGRRGRAVEAMGTAAEVLRWAGVVLGGVAMVAALSPLPADWRRRVPHIRSMLLGWGAVAVGSGAEHLHWPTGLRTSLSLAVPTLLACLAVRWALAARRDRRADRAEPPSRA